MSLEVFRVSRGFATSYIILREFIKCVLLPFTEVVGPIMNLISGTYYFCERREYAFNILSEYYIITYVLLSHAPKQGIYYEFC
jgi:hypothetical protein